MATNIPDYATYYKQRQLYAPPEVATGEEVTLPPRRDVRFPALEAYADQVSHTPRREDYKPRFWDRLIASMSGFSEGGLRGGGAGVSSAMDVLNTPYRRALEDYNIRLGGYKGAADVEGEIFNRGQSVESQRLREILGMLNARNAGRRASAAELTAQTSAKRLPLYERDVKTRENRGTAYSKFSTEIYPQIQRERLGQQKSDAERRAQLYGDRTRSMERTAAARINKPAAPPKERFPAPKDQATIDGLALRELRLQVPDLYAEFVNDDGKSVRVKGATGKVEGWIWDSDMNPEQKLEQQKRFARFQSLLDAKRVEILQRSGLSAAGYPAIEGDSFSVDGGDENEDDQGVLTPSDDEEE